MNEPIGLSEIFKSAGTIYKTNFRLYLSLSLLFAVTTVAISKILGVQNSNDPSAFIYMIISTLISSWFSISLIYASVFLLQGKNISFSQALRMPRERYISYLLVNAMLILLVMCGFFLFIIPGIYFAVVYNFASTLTVLEKTDFKTSFVKSMSLVKGYFFPILGFFGVVVVCVFFPEIAATPIKGANPSMGLAISRIISTLVVPFIMIAQVALFLRMTEIKKDQYLA